MKLHEVKPAKGSRSKPLRKGRGDAAGKGSFSGRGCKGQKARTGGGVRLGFEGGQTSLLRRTPKLRGFRNPSRIEYRAINLYTLEEKYETDEVVSPQTLVIKKLIANESVPVKILADGELTKKLTFEGVKISITAAKKLGIKLEAKAPKAVEPKKKS